MKLYHQADSVSCAMVEHAHKAMAKATNTLHVENQPADAIHQAIITIEVSEVEEIHQDGGQVAVEDLKCNKVLVTISGACNCK
jgi:Fe-S cluster biogenesis protein NfuA